MYINIRLKTRNEDLVTLQCPIPSNLPYHEDDNLEDIVTDWLNHNGVEYKWFRILKDEAEHVSSVVGQSEQLVCDVCGSTDVIEAPHMGKNCNRCHPI